MRDMPNHITQWNPTINYKQPWFELYFDGPNKEFGSFRASPLPGYIAQNKHQVMFLLRLAYETPIHSWKEALQLIHEKRLRLMAWSIAKGQMNVQYL